MNARPIVRIALVLGLGLVSGACIDRLVPVEYIGLCGFPSTAECLPPAGTCERYINGQLYLYYENDGTLEMVAEFDNQRLSTVDSSPGAVNTGNAIITEYRFSFRATPPLALRSRTVPFLTTPIPTGGSATVFIPVLPFETVLELRASPGYEGFISVEVTPRGHYGDASSFEVGPITIPVQVFAGAPPATTCPDPTIEPVFCPSEFQTHSTDCSGGAGTTFVIAGTINGLTGAGLVLATPGQVSLTVPAGANSFTFPTGVPDGTIYNVTVVTQPAGQTCVVTGGTGTVTGANPVGITITCG